MAVEPAFLNAVTKKQIVIRMLNNLLPICGQTQQVEAILAAITRR